MSDADWITLPRPTLRHVHGEWMTTELDFVPDDWPYPKEET